MIEKMFDKIDGRIFGRKSTAWSLRIQLVSVDYVVHEIRAKKTVVGFYIVSRNLASNTDNAWRVELMTDGRGSLIEADLTIRSHCDINESFNSHNEAMRYIDKMINPWHWKELT